MENTMSEQKTALEVILTQKDKGGLSDAAILLHKKQSEDAEKMDERMKDIEKKVDALDGKVDALSGKVDEIKKIVILKSSFWGNLKEVLSNKIFIYLLLVFMAVVFGIPIAEVGTFLFK